MIYIICGRSGSGKTTLAGLMERYFNLKRIKPYTTRPKRSDDDTEYEFISPGTFKYMKLFGLFAEDSTYKTFEGDWSYGTEFSSYEGDDDKVVVLNPLCAKRIKEQFDARIIFLDTHPTTCLHRLCGRDDDLREIERRLTEDEESFKDIYDLADFVIDQSFTKDLKGVLAG